MRLVRIQSLDYAQTFKKFIPELKKNGSSYKCKSPFNPTEKTPSFVINTRKKIWHCFSTDEGGGDIVSFIMKKDNLRLEEALTFVESFLGLASNKKGDLKVLQTIMNAVSSKKHEFKGSEQLRKMYEDKLVNFIHSFLTTMKIKGSVWHVIEYVYDEFDKMHDFSHDQFDVFIKEAYKLLCFGRETDRKEWEFVAECPTISE